MPKGNVFRGLTAVSVLLLSASTVMGMIFEKYPQGMDQTWGTQSSKTVTIQKEGSENNWSYVSKYKNAKEAVAGYKDLALREAAESFVLLKNTSNALPLAANPKVSLLGIRSYAPYYGNTGGSIPDKNTVDAGNDITKCFQDEGLQLNPGRLQTYQAFFKDKTWGKQSFGAVPPIYPDYTKNNDVPELSSAELAAQNSNYKANDAEYKDAAIVIVGRPAGEQEEYRPGAAGFAAGSTTTTTTGNILGLSDKEKEMIAEAKAISDKVIVLINSTNVMEIKELKDDPDIDAIMWIGFPGAYGFRAVANVLQGKINPSGRLGEVYVTNGLTAPAMQNFGDDTPWDDATKAAGENLNSYLIEAEGIYTGYRYYETRYADALGGKTSATTAKAGTYTTGNGVLGTGTGTWNYDQEVVYPFGAGLSYTTFTETLDSVNIASDHRTAEVKVTVKNTGNVAGKHVVELYAQTPYTQYDVDNKVEKSAIQLMDFEKTAEIKAGETETVTLNVDMNNLASYDYTNAKTFIVDDGTYYFALGSDAHDALNNVLAKKGTTSADGNASMVYEWNWSGHTNGVDTKTFSVADNGINITNKLSEGIYATDWNAFQANTVTYLTRNDWNGTFPKTYVDLKPSATMSNLLDCDFIDLESGDTSSYVWGKANGLTIKDFKNAAWDDERWDDLVDQVSISEFLTFASKAFHNLQEIPSVGLSTYTCDDGPGGSDTHTFAEGEYQGTPWADVEENAKVGEDSSGKGIYLGTRVTPSQTNIAYTWNKELAWENGEIILGETSVDLKLPIMIGPAMNIKRHGYNGRGGEYLSEDPILSGYIGSAIVQGAQSMGCLVNIKHAAFNDQEINRSGVAAFLNEQAARELELRNLNQAFTAKGKPSKWVADSKYDDYYTEGALGVMTSYNRIGAVASSANKAVMVDIMRDEWGFKGYNVTDFTGVTLKASPKESLMAGTTAFCGFGSPSFDYWSEDYLKNIPEMCEAIKLDIKYVLYSVCHSNILNNTDVTIVTEWQMTSWRAMYIAMIAVSAVLVAGFGTCSVLFNHVLKKKEDK